MPGSFPPQRITARRSPRVKRERKEERKVLKFLYVKVNGMLLLSCSGIKIKEEREELNTEERKILKFLYVKVLGMLILSSSGVKIKRERKELSVVYVVYRVLRVFIFANRGVKI